MRHRFAALTAVVAALSASPAVASSASRPVHAIGMASDFKIYQEQFYSGMYERLDQNTNLFGAASSNCFKLTTQVHKGDFTQESFFQLLQNITSRRDTTTTAAAADMHLSMGENVTVKLNRKIGPVAQTYDALRKLGVSAEEISMKLGAMTGDAILLDYVNTAVGALVAALGGVATVNVDRSAATTPTLVHTHLVDAQATYGDRMSSIACFVMHSKPYADLMKQSIADKIFNVANVTIYNGTVATLGKPVVVIDAPDLLVTGTPNKYKTLALRPGAIEIEESEEKYITSQEVTGAEQLFTRIQGEYAFNVEVLGFSYKMATGPNPTNAQIKTSANWLQTATSTKDLGGAVLLTQ